MALPAPIIPAAPTPFPVPLPPPAPGPVREPTEISYTAYSPSPSSLALHKDRMKRIKEWTAEVPIKHRRPRLEDLGAGGTGSGSTVTFGQAVGVGSADWSDASGSETGTVPTTVRQERKERIELVRARQSVSAKRPAPPEASSIVPVVARPTPPTAAKIAASKHPGQAALAPTSPEAVPKSPTKPPSASSRVRSSPVPLLALPPESANAPKISPAPSPRLASGSGDLLYPPPPVGATHSQREAYIASALDLPLDLLTQRDNALAPPSRVTPPSSASSQITTSRLGSLLGRTKGDGRRVASEGTGAGSATGSLRRTANAGDALRSRQDQGRQESTRQGTAMMGAPLARSKTAGATLEGARPAANQNHTTSHPPPVSRARTLTANNAVPTSITAQGVRSNATAILAAAQPLPQSSGRTIHHSDRRSDATVAQGASRPPLSGASANSHANSWPTNPGVSASARPPPPPAAMTAPTHTARTERTAVRAAAIPLPASATTTVPSSQATAKPVKMSIDPDPFAAPPPPRLSSIAPSAATYIQAAQIPMPASAPPHPVHGSQHESVQVSSHHQYAPADTGPESIPVQYTQTWPRSSAVDRLGPPLPPQPPQPLHVPLAPPASGSPAAPIIAPHRQQLALPRPALSRSAGSFDGLARSLGRKQRDPSLTNLHTRFEPALYPLPPSATASTPVTLPPPPVPVSVSVRAQYEGPLTGQTPADMLTELPQAPLTRSPEVIPQPPVAQWQGPILPVPARPRFPVNYFEPMPVPPILAASPLSKELAFPPINTFGGIADPQHPVLIPPMPLVGEPLPGPLFGNPLPEPLSSPTRLQSSNDATPQDIQFTPSSGEVERVREEEDHVSFEVPSGSRGRLRVSLAWLRDGTRSPRWRRAQTVRSEVSASSPPPPPVPPKPPSAATSQRRTSRPTNPPRASDSEGLPPVPRPVIRDPPKREDIKSPVDPGESAQSPKPTPPQAPGWYNPYYSEATLPPYRPHAQISQVYQMQLGQPNPWGFPQPGSMPVTPTYNLWTGMTQARPPGAASHGPPTVPPPSPRPESIEPPSDNGTPPSPPMGPYPLPGGGYPAAMLDMQAPMTNAYGDLTRRYLAPPKQSFWSKLHGERSARDEGDGPRQREQDDNAAIRAWRRNISRDGESIGAQQMGRDRNYPPPTMGRGMRLERTDLLDAPNQNRNRPPPLRRRGSSAWDRLMWRRRTEEGYYSRPRRSRQNDGATGRAPTFPSGFSLPFGRNNTARRERKGPANGVYQAVGRDREQARRDREREKEERRRARRERRDGRQARAKASTSGMGSQRPSYSLGSQNRRSAMGSQNRPNALRSQASAVRARSPAPRAEEIRRGDRGYEDGARTARARGQETVSRWFSNVVRTAQPTRTTQRPAAAEARNDGPPRREISTRQKDVNWKDRLASSSRRDTKLKRGPTGHSSRPAYDGGTATERKDGNAKSQWDRVKKLVGTRG